MLDIFFEVLNYETIEQKKAYEIAGLLGELLMALSPSHALGMVRHPITQIGLPTSVPQVPSSPDIPPAPVSFLQTLLLSWYIVGGGG